MPVRGPQKWNIWELDRISREAAPESGDPNERAALLLHLRQFADSNGELPVEFDGLVRESFGGLLAGVGPA
jgi:hypothetical protein